MLWTEVQAMINAKEETLMRKKIIFWDWLGTLAINSLEKNLYKKNIYDYISYAWFLVEQFHAANVKQVIITNGSDQEILPNVSYMPFKKFEMIMTATHFKPKPHPQMIDFALMNLNLATEEAVLIGDTQTDAQAAQSADIEFLKVDGTLRSYFNIANNFNFIKL